MKTTKLKLEKRDLKIIGVSALGGFLLVSIVLITKDVAMALLAGLFLGVPGGAGGGVLGCLLGRYLERKRQK